MGLNPMGTVFRLWTVLVTPKPVVKSIRQGLAGLVLVICDTRLKLTDLKGQAALCVQSAQSRTLHPRLRCCGV